VVDTASVDVNYQQESTCSVCGTFEVAPILIGDGKALVCQPGASQSSEEGSCGPARVGSLFKDRVLIAHAGTRELLLRYTGRMQRTKGLKDRKEFDVSELPILLNTVQQHATFLYDWLLELESPRFGSASRKKEHLQFLAELSYPTSVDGGLFKRAHEVRPMLANLASGNAVSLSASKLFRDAFPALARLLERDPQLTQGLPPYLLLVMSQLLEVGDNLRNVPANECCPQVNVVWEPIVHDDDLRIGYCYSTLTETCPSNNYSKTTRINDYECRDGSCSKATKKFQRVMPGLFAVFCPHGINLGSHFMNNWESPETFSLLMRRRRIAPLVVIYDYACGLHAYAMNREPWFFRHTQFYIDKFHWRGHVGCSVGYCLDRFPLFNAINSEVAEEVFSLLDRIKTAVSFMGLENAMRFVRLFFLLQNRQRLQFWNCSRLISVSAQRKLEIQQSWNRVQSLIVQLNGFSRS